MVMMVEAVLVMVMVMVVKVVLVMVMVSALYLKFQSVNLFFEEGTLLTLS